MCTQTTVVGKAIGFHYVLTVQTRSGEQLTVSSVAAFDPAQFSRSEAYREIRAIAADELGHGDFTVLFFSLELDAF
ncbi:hypothetical protein FNV65_37160 [Streptomyces sp. S1A1-8]|uniref:hypothetical protein n=1 Tax=unclassified Streptomyces TaxID=2593676 RepID=UPI001163528C|nr:MULTISPECIES: hypothetical protein [unclassified Streptomyces]QDO01115.1 hypothetical protein FNV58_38580 [Streptomyces sp. RLB1-9]QDO22845.1 hypothetical protein FNV65_37160 [Streptomyces sp. S1A1-8]QDO32972.1 hypothetical protein FNV63_37180 [Streptomyces sp. S1A1-3]